MGFQCGIVGLPNVGKSTLFNALTATQAAQAANYPFCTIEPNVGRVAVPDPRLDTLAKIGKSATIIPTQLEFVDIAGLVRGASKGEGLGNQFLAHIREVDAVLYVLRCFESTDITHVEGSVNALRDAETVETELMLADMDGLERRVTTAGKKAKGGDADAKLQLPILEKTLAALQAGKPARSVALNADEKSICNVSEDDAATGNAMTEQVAERAKAEGAGSVVISAAIESEIAQLAAAEQADFLETLGLDQPGLNKVIRAGYSLLDLITYFTVGPKEARAWTVRRNAKGPEAAGVIHGDFERGFIRAETISYDDFVACGGEQGARDSGKLRSEGKDYVVQDGDVMHFRFNV
jgi:ribosome-binding ATPase